MHTTVGEVFVHSIEEGLLWDFYEDADDAEEYAANCTVPGRIVGFLDSSLGSQADKTLGLLSAFAARRSLVCWFVYCDNERPLEIAQHVIDFWLPRKAFALSLHESWTQTIEPSENGVPIVDCRLSDTRAASSSVAHAAKFAMQLRRHDAITSLSHAFNSYDVSPAGSVDNFEQWIVEYAVPVAIQQREMTSYEEFALADFQIPDFMKRRPQHRPKS